MSQALPVAQWLTYSAEGPIARRGSQLFTRQHWQREVLILGHALLARPQQKWALCFEDSYLFSIALLAALHAGKVPVVPGHCRESLLQEQSSEFDAVLTDMPLALSCPVVNLTESAAGNEPLPALPPIDPQACIVLFTSGSTGTPRQIVKPVSCLDEEARWLADRWGERLEGCTVIATVSHQHLYGLTFRLILPLALGLVFDCRQVFYSEQLSAQDPHLKFALISSPAFLRRLDRTLAAPDCRLIVSAGGVLPWTSAQEVNSWLKLPVDEIYGSTETGVLATRSRAAEDELWQPFSGVQFRQDHQQRWWATSPLISEPEGLQLDDKLQFTAVGFQLCGRYDRIVKIEDKRVSLSEIERRLLALPQVVDAVALSVSRPERSGIGVVLVLNAAYSEQQLIQLKRDWRHELHRWLEPVAMPRYWRIVETIPHNSQSKRAWPQIQELFYAAR
ncbi:AMP-binding protein [Erwinia billingiae]|uniref:Putative AMP-binding enzyme n=1 Tax=Erwinia billingiae (strain Eb661) TaxID=634500 RepID=D8MQL7_ERWBE|nr:Putative AMP-binding enzyme [Erwinia billingiae Eb661]